MPDAIFFDLDDTIVLWETTVETVWKSSTRRFTKDLGNLAPDELYQAIRSVSDWYWSDPVRHRNGRLNLPAARREIGKMSFQRLGRTDLDLAVKMADAFTAEREKTGSLSPGAIELLQSLRKRGIRLAMITNGASDIQRGKIERFGLAPYFDNILIEGEFGCGKPEENVFRHTCETLNVKPSSAWMVGDDLRFDISPCRKLGIYSLWVDRKGDGEAGLDGIRPDRIIRDIAEISGML